jgi:Zn-dependent protease
MARKYVIVGYTPEDRGAGRVRFSQRELGHIALSMLVLTIGFALFLSNIMVFGFVQEFFLLNLIVGAVAVSTEFLLHELAHKFTAQKYGCWSEYRYSEFGLIMVLLSGFAGFLLAAPGVVYHSGRITKEEEGKISAAGPATNLALAGIFFSVFFLFRNYAAVDPFVTYLLSSVAWINVWVGGFNMVPISPLDGSKVAKWSITAYVLLFAGIVAMGVGIYYVSLL